VAPVMNPSQQRSQSQPQPLGPQRATGMSTHSFANINPYATGPNYYFPVMNMPQQQPFFPPPPRAASFLVRACNNATINLNRDKEIKGSFFRSCAVGQVAANVAPYACHRCEAREAAKILLALSESEASQPCRKPRRANKSSTDAAPKHPEISSTSHPILVGKEGPPPQDVVVIAESDVDHLSERREIQQEENVSYHNGADASFLLASRD
jgi:hypothetical protein